MTVTVSIAQAALAAILRAKAPQAGLLVGFQDGSNMIVLSAAFCSLEELGAAQETVAGLLPPPLVVLGAHVARAEDVAAAQRVLGPAAALVAVPAGEGLECFVGKEHRSVPAAALPSGAGGGGAGGSAVAGALAERFLPVRCSADLVLQVVQPAAAAAGGAPASAAVAAAFGDLRDQACGPSARFLAVEAAGGDSETPRLQPPGAESLEAMGASWSSPLQLKLYSSATSGSGVYAAPSLRFQPGKATVFSAALHLDVLCYAPQGMPAAEAVAQVVRPALAAQLDQMQREVDRRGGDLAPLRALHFLPPGLPHHITLVYPLPTPSIEDDEEALLGRRHQLHQLLGLPTNRPLLRVANSLEWPSGGGGGGGAGAAGGTAAGGGVGGKPRLADVHAALPASSVGSSVHLVQGTYDYFHYMQDKFDDSGWGCAYRSLQTICSWFARQLYTTRPVPSHREIQQTLVSIGDKPAGFIGSKQWIGAIELGFVLDTLLGVSCKVLTVPSGDDMPSKAREIAHHFDTQGTPIMIGGGVLAYTLLGIDFNERTGDCAFLILDPHYTGPEDLKRIHTGQWVAWKKLGDKAAAGGELFVAGAFYNLLCPQRPNTV